MRHILLPLVFSFIAVTVWAQNQPQLIKDITPGEGNSDITELTTVGDVVFFIGPDGTNGFQLWRTDGTETGTYVVKVINPGVTGMYSYITSLVNVNGILFFLADDGIHGVELWNSDGTEAGTTLVKDIYPGAGDAFSDAGIDGDYQAVIGDVFYFNACSGGNDNELWRSDGTETGTYRVKDIVAGSNGSQPVLLTNAGGILYFECKNSSGGHEVWKSDGTESGTVFLKAVPYVGNSDVDGSNFFIEYNGYVYFTAAVVDYNEELFRSDGTPSGTGLFIDLDASDGSYPHSFHILNNKLFFIAEVANENHLFTSEGTVTGTQFLDDMDGNAALMAPFAGSKMISAGDKLYYNGLTNGESALWITDGTSAGTYKIANLELDFPTNETAISNKIVFRSKDESAGCYTLYESDGSPEGTVKSFDCDLVTPNDFLVTLGNKVIFMGTSDNEGREIWLYEPSFVSGIESPESPAFPVFPNPSSSGIFQFNIHEAGESAIANVYDALGRKIYESGKNVLSGSYTIDLASFPKGIYLLEIADENQRMISKLIYE